MIQGLGRLDLAKKSIRNHNQIRGFNLNLSQNEILYNWLNKWKMDSAKHSKRNRHDQTILQTTTKRMLRVVLGGSWSFPLSTNAARFGHIDFREKNSCKQLAYRFWRIFFWKFRQYTMRHSAGIPMVFIHSSIYITRMFHANMVRISEVASWSLTQSARSHFQSPDTRSWSSSLGWTRKRNQYSWQFGSQVPGSNEKDLRSRCWWLAGW